MYDGSFLRQETAYPWAGLCYVKQQAVRRMSCWRLRLHRCVEQSFSDAIATGLVRAEVRQCGCLGSNTEGFSACVRFADFVVLIIQRFCFNRRCRRLSGRLRSLQSLPPVPDRLHNCAYWSPELGRPRCELDYCRAGTSQLNYGKPLFSQTKVRLVVLPKLGSGVIDGAVIRITASTPGRESEWTIRDCRTDILLVPAIDF